MTIHSNALSAVVANSLDGIAVNATNSANTGEETLNDAVQPSSPGSMKYALIGGVPYIVFTPPNDTSVARAAFSGLPNLTALATRCMWTPIGTPSVAEDIHHIRNPSAPACILQASSGSSPRFLLLDSASGGLWTSTVLTNSHPEFRIEVNIPAIGSSSTTGQIQVKIYDGPLSSATLLDDSGLLTGKNLGSTGITVIRWGMLHRTSAQASTMRNRYFAYNDVAGFVGGVSTSPPVISVGGDLITRPFETVAMTAVASDPAGGSLTYRWQLLSNTSISSSGTLSASGSLTSTTASGTSYAAPADWGIVGSQQVWRCTVTSSTTGLTASDDLTVIVAAATVGVVVSTGPIVIKAKQAGLRP